MSTVEVGSEIERLTASYDAAIEKYKVCKRALNECDLEIEIARARKDMNALRMGLSERNRLLVDTEAATQGLRDAAYEVVKYHGMTEKPESANDKAGLLSKILERIASL